MSVHNFVEKVDGRTLDCLFYLRSHYLYLRGPGIWALRRPESLSMNSLFSTVVRYDRPCNVTGTVRVILLWWVGGQA